MRVSWSAQELVCRLSLYKVIFVEDKDTSFGYGYFWQSGWETKGKMGRRLPEFREKWMEKKKIKIIFKKMRKLPEATDWK